MGLFDDAVDTVAGYIPEYELTGNLIQAYASIMESLAPVFYTYIGQKVAVLLWGIVFSIACLAYAIHSLGKKQIPIEEAKGVLWFLGLLAANSALGTPIWFGVNALITFVTEKATDILNFASDLIGIPLEPVTGDVTHPLAKLAALLDAQVGNIGDLGFNVMDNTSVWSMVTSTYTTASSYVFGFILVFVFGALSFFYSFLLIRSHAYVMFVFIMSPLIIPCAGLKATISIATASLKTALNGILTMLVPTFVLSIVVTIISAIKRLSGCVTHFHSAYQTQCADEIESMGDVFGMQIPNIATPSGTIDFYMLLIGVGLISFMLILVSARYVSQVFGGPNDSSPVAIIAATMAAVKTAGVMAKAGKLTGQAGKTLATKGIPMLGRGLGTVGSGLSSTVSKVGGSALSTGSAFLNRFRG